LRHWARCGSAAQEAETRSGLFGREELDAAALVPESRAPVASPSIVKLPYCNKKTVRHRRIGRRNIAGFRVAVKPTQPSSSSGPRTYGRAVGSAPKTKTKNSTSQRAQIISRSEKGFFMRPAREPPSITLAGASLRTTNKHARRPGVDVDHRAPKKAASSLAHLSDEAQKSTTSLNRSVSRKIGKHPRACRGGFQNQPRRFTPPRRIADGLLPDGPLAVAIRPAAISPRPPGQTSRRSAEFLYYFRSTAR